MNRAQATYCNVLAFSACILTGVFVILMRLSRLQYLFDGTLLWGEDGKIFFNQASTMGLESLFYTYAGYIHLYPRMVGYLASYMKIIHIPILFSAAWLFSYIFMLSQVSAFFKNRQFHFGTTIFVCVLVGMIPHSGESFFNITNAQFFLATGLLLFLLNGHRFEINVVNVTVLIILSLTGPFSVLFLPVLFLNVMARKDFKVNHVKYVLVAVAALIQVLLISASDTRYGGDFDPSIVHWLKSIYVFITFGGKGLISVLGIAVWLIVLAHLVTSVCNVINKRVLSENQKVGLLLVAALVIIYFTGLWSYRQYPNALHPLEGGARYYVIPYTLLVVVLPLLVRDRRYLYFAFVALAIVGAKQFTIIEKRNLNFESYAWLTECVENLSIPIHPQWETYPGWSMEVRRPQIQESQCCHSIDVIDSLEFGGVHTASLFEQENRFLIFDIPPECSSSRHIGVLVDVTRKNEGWAQMFYVGDRDGFANANSLRRFYPGGNIVMQFAFLNDQMREIWLDLKQDDEDERVLINDIQICCDIE